MTFAGNIAAGGKSPVYILEFNGDAVDAAEFDSAANWSAVADATAPAMDTTDSKSGTGSVGWDKTGATNQNSIARNSSLAFSLADGAYQTIWVRMPTTTAGTADSCRVYVGNDLSNGYEWIVPASFFTEGEWTKLYLSVNELSSDYTSRTAFGTPTATGMTVVQVNFRGTASAYTFTGARIDFLAEHPYRYSTGRLTSPVADTKEGWMMAPSITENRYDPTRGTLSSSSASCKVVDPGGATVISDLNSFAMLRRQSTVKMGFRGKAETSTNFESIFQGPVDKTPHSGKTWTFQLGDMLRKFKLPFAQAATSASPYTISGNILTVLLKLALSTGNGTNLGAFAANYDTEATANGAGISADLLSTDIETTRDDWMAQDSCSFTFTEPQDSLLEWFLKEVCFAFGVFPVVKAGGLLSVRAVEEGVYPNASAVTFGTSNVIAGKIPPFTQDSQRIKNQVRILYGWDATTDEEFDGDSADTYQLASSVTRYGVQVLKIESKGILLADTDVVQRVANRYLRLLGEGAPPVELSTFMSQQPREPGELVTLTIPRTLPDLDAATYGISGKQASIESRSFDPATASCKFRVGITSYQQGNYRLISSIAGDYDSATAVQKATYGFISDASDQLGAANDPTHAIGPG